MFSVIGLIAAFLTVVLWLPTLDRAAPLRQHHNALAFADCVIRFWAADTWRQTRMIVLGLAIAVAALGLMRFRADDDVRRLQSLAPDLLREQEAIQNVIGATAATQFLLIEGADDETALVRGEALLPVLARLASEGALSSAQSPAAFVPSVARQRENLALRQKTLDGPQLARLQSALGMPAPKDTGAAASDGVLTLQEALASGAVPFLNELVLGPGLHVVALQGLKNTPAVRAAVGGLSGVRYVDPTADFSALLGRYRVRAMLLTLLSVLAMYAVMIWRYGITGAGWVILPAAAAAVLVPAILALLGQPYTFFRAMAQVILLAVGTDYALFCAEAQAGRNAATLFSVWLAALTTILSFGLLVFSAAPAVRDFGGTMLLGILLSVALAPLANRAQRRQ